MSLFPTDMGFPPSKQCHEELFLIFVPLIIYIVYITITFSTHTRARARIHACTHTCAYRILHTFVLQGRRVIEEGIITDTVRAVAKSSQSLFIATFG